MVVFSLTLVRHGETSFNRKSIIQGQRDIPLSHIGMQQAKLVGRRLQNERYTHVFASDLARASHTAQAIVEANQVCCSPIVHDKRLRERKFGSMEGKSSNELLTSAKKANTTPLHFTPEGGETIEQLKERTNSFFNDLCQTLVTFVEENEEVDYIPASLKRPHGGSLGRNSAQLKSYILNRRSQSLCGLSTVTSVGNGEADTGAEDYYKSDNKRFRIDPYDDDDDGDEYDGHSISLESVIDRPVADFGVEIAGDKDDFEDSVDSVIARSNSSSSSGYSSLPDGADSSETSTPTDTNFKMDASSTVKPAVSYPRFVSQSSGAEIQGSSATGSAYKGCPNVSLSPLVEHRLSSVSSISSGRNNSFEEMDALPPSIAEVLVVSHGGMLKELIRHFVETMQCKIPGGKGHALRVCPNTGVSKFMVNVDDVTKKPVVTCLVIHDKDHLFEMAVVESGLAV